MKRREFLHFVIGTFSTAVFTCATAICCNKRSKRPNIVLVMTDDQGYGDIHSHGNTNIDTPVLDKLAAGGARFDRFYVSPVCAPTRASVLTGRYHLRTNAVWVTRGLETMREEEVTIAQVLKKAGYATGCFGKWHNGAHYPYHPNGKGFDEFLGFCAGHWNIYFDTKLDHNGKMVKTKGYIADVITDAAIDFIEKHRNEPFFCYIPYNTPHSPFQVPDKYCDKYKRRGLSDITACVYAMCENIDNNVGRILERLAELKLSNDTIFIFLSDNGPNSKRFNDGMRGRKASVHEGGVRVPLFIQWPRIIKPGTLVGQITAHIDLFPTILDMCHIKAPDHISWDGISLLPLLKRRTKSWPNRTILTHQSRRGGIVERAPGSVRTDQYRLVVTNNGNELYDMIRDPGQQHDVAQLHPDITKKLAYAYEAWYNDVTQKGFENLPIPVGYPQSPSVELPAHEGFLHGNMKYMDQVGYTNAWITQWTSIDDYIWWNVDIVRDGEYEIILKYTCPKENLGATVEVEVGGQRLQGTIQTEHDPNPIPAPILVPHDHYYEKIWASLKLGTVNLKKGRTKLYVRALKKIGKTVMDLKAVRISSQVY